MKSWQLKDKSYISTDCLNRYQLNGSKTDAPDGLHILKDSTELTVKDGRVIKSLSKTWDRLEIEDVSPIKKKMAEVKEPASKKTLPDPEKTYSSQQAAEFQTRSREAEREKRLERIKRGQPPVHKKRQHLPPGC